MNALQVVGAVILGVALVLLVLILLGLSLYIWITSLWLVIVSVRGRDGGGFEDGMEMLMFTSIIWGAVLLGVGTLVGAVIS